MPSAAFFTSLGFFVRRNFVDAEGCEQLIGEASQAPCEPSLVVRHGVDDILDKNFRCASSALVSKATRLRMKQRFAALTPDLEAHFGTALAGSETPGFLIYDTGAFFAAHTDTGADDPDEIRRRRISAILFLNGPSGDSSASGFGGGTLRFHRLLDGPHWEACPFAFDPEPGMLVAFRSDVIHEVQPVTSGRRFTIVTWFLAGDA
jgi:SM-20-related protein